MKAKKEREREEEKERRRRTESSTMRREKERSIIPDITRLFFCMMCGAVLEWDYTKSLRSPKKNPAFFDISKEIAKLYPISFDLSLFADSFNNSKLLASKSV